jgi:signal transduction histidine kinase
LESEGERLSRLIQNVLDFAKLENKNKKTQPRPRDLAQVFDQAARIMEQPLGREGFALSMDIQRPFVLPFDKELLLQVLLNLMENSVKFGKGAKEKRIALSAQKEKDRVVIRVSDTGPGIGKKHLKKIFRDFYRPDTDLTRHTGGTGIGLALVRRSVKLMGGTVKARNNPERGCSIIIRLPKCG